MSASDGLSGSIGLDIAEDTATLDRAVEEPDLYPERRTDPNGNAILELIAPDTLPAGLDLPDAEKEVLHAMLCDLVAALRMNRQEGTERLALLLQRIGSPETSPAQVERTGIPADADKVTDFDQFFRVSRVVSTRPALSLVKGLARTAHAVVQLFDRLDDLSEDRARQQIDGFVAYAHLLARTFGLGKLS